MSWDGQYRPPRGEGQRGRVLGATPHLLNQDLNVNKLARRCVCSFPFRNSVLGDIIFLLGFQAPLPQLSKRKYMKILCVHGHDLSGSSPARAKEARPGTTTQEKRQEET